VTKDFFYMHDVVYIRIQPNEPPITVRATNDCGESETLNITIIPPLTGNGLVSPYQQNVVMGSSYTTMSVSNYSGGNNTYTYQWQFSTDNNDFTDISGATGSTYTPSGLTVIISCL
jgi:hypothetical protein